MANPTMTVGTLDHVNIRTRRFQESLHFYEEVLGLQNGPRPNFSFPGAWLYSEGRVVLHLVDLRPGSEPQKADSGVVDHIAFASSGFHAMKQHLQNAGAEFETRETAGRPIWQIFVRDPNGMSVELNYNASDEQVEP